MSHLVIIDRLFGNKEFFAPHTQLQRRAIVDWLLILVHHNYLYLMDFWFMVSKKKLYPIRQWQLTVLLIPISIDFLYRSCPNDFLGIPYVHFQKLYLNMQRNMPVLSLEILIYSYKNCIQTCREPCLSLIKYFFGILIYIF